MSAAVTHVKMEALAMTASTSTAASALRGTRMRTVKQVRVAVLVFVFVQSFMVSSSNCCARFSLIMSAKYATITLAVQLMTEIRIYVYIYIYIYIFKLILP